MSASPVSPLWRGSARILMLSTATLAAAAAAVLAMGSQDVRLLRLGLVAALWAALFSAFAAAKMRDEARSCADHAHHLQETYQFELERELRQQTELSQQGVIGELRAEIAAMRANLERLGAAPLMERVTLRAESTRMVPLPAQACHHDDNQVVAAAVPARRGSIASTPRFGPVHPHMSNAASTPIPVGRQESRSEIDPSAAFGQRTVDDLLAAHGSPPIPRRRRSHAHPE